MQTIETMGTVTAQGILVIQVPAHLPAGMHHVVVVVDERSAIDRGAGHDLPLYDLGPWPANLSLRREELYDAWGR